MGKKIEKGNIDFIYVKKVTHNKVILNIKAKQMAQSIEPNIAELANGWLKSHKLPYKLEQEYLNIKEFEASKSILALFP